LAVWGLLEGPVEVRFSRIEVPRPREARPTCSLPDYVRDALLRALHGTQGPLQRNGCAVRGPGSVAPDTTRGSSRPAPPERPDARPDA